MSHAANDLPGAQQGATRRNNKKMPSSAAARFLRSRNELSERQRRAIELLLRGFGDQDVAGQLGVDRGTVFRWRKNIAFAREMDRQRHLLWEQSVSQLQSMVQPALTILSKQLTSDDPKSALRAAAVLLRFATPSRLLAPNAAADVEQESKQFSQDLIDYIDAPLPGQPGCPEDPATYADLDDDET